MALKYFETATAYTAANPKDSDICFVEEEKAVYTHGEKFGGDELYIETTYADLKDLRDNGNLVPGQQYRITDYEFTTSASKTTSAGYNFDIIVTADDENTLNENARAVTHPGVAYFNDIALQAWQLKYCIDNDTDRFTWAQKDTGYCIMISNSSEWFEYTGITNVVDGVTYYMFGAFYGCTSATPSINDEWKMFMGTSVMTSGSVYNVKEPTAGGKGVIYYMKDEYDNECPYDFKNLQYNIKKGFKVVISNSSSGPYTYTYEATGNSSVVSSTTYYEYTCAQQDMMGPGLPGILYVKVSTLDSSMNLYSSINPVTEFTGYVAAMQWDVSINNIINSTQTIWTFDGGYSDATRLGYVSGVKMGSYITSYAGRYQLPWNYIRTNAGDTAYGIIFEDGCTNIHLGSQSQYNITFKHGCNNISTDYACRNIICEEGCSYITIGARCYNLHFGVNCSRITVSTDGHDNSFGASCSSITLGKENFRCSFGNGCYSIETGQYSYDYYFGNGCTHIKFGTSSAIKNYYSNIVVEPGNKYIYLSCTGTTSDTSPYKNVTIAQGVNNTTTWKTITDANVNQTYRTVYQPANSLTITV